ncbi:MAG: hypothetical protein J6B85_08470 [Lachnospiraceae bacterium]|nr:hypothetical protein [Lachnospiraceae bacterium]
MTYQEITAKIAEIHEEISLAKRKAIRAEQAIEKQKEELEELCDEMYRQKRDVDALTKLSFGSLLKKISGSYDESYEKEYREYIEAKLKYDAKDVEIEELKRERDASNNRARRGEAELDQLYEELVNYPEAGEAVQERQERLQEIEREIKELKEAVAAAERVIRLINQVKSAYASAKGWATYDTFFYGGLIGDLLKYDNIDQAESLSAELSAASKQLQRELKDVGMVYQAQVDSIDTTTKAIDIWFDNIFTDLGVREKIEHNISEMDVSLGKMERLLAELKGRLKKAEEKRKE